MELLKLESDNPKFKTIDFKPGLNIIAGLQLTKEQKKTYNGVGKSFSLNLIHYILGAKIKDDKIKRYLSNYGTFKLSFKHNDSIYFIEKNFGTTDYILNEKAIRQTNYPNELNNIFIPENKEYSFRQIFNCFARRHGGTFYSNILTQQGLSIHEYYQRFVNLQLLGVDSNLIKERFDIKEQISKLEKASSVIDEYQNKIDNSNLKDIIEKIEKLNSQIDNFQIAENYNLLKQEADELTRELNNARNELFNLNEILRRKIQVLTDADVISISSQEIQKIYNEAEFFFKDNIINRLEDAQFFHHNLLENRKNRLEKEINELKINISEKELSILEISQKRDERLKILDSTGALEEYNSLKNEINRLTKEKEDLEKYKNILSDFKKDKSNLQTRNSIVREKSIVYIQETSTYFNKVEDQFRSLVKRFYDNKGGSLSIEDTVDAKYLYNINAYIPKEGSQGVGEVKIFCYDILLFLLNKQLINFLAHDGCIFSEMDPRQKSMILKIAIENCKTNNLQYFINMNQNSLEEIIADNNTILTNDEKKYITKSIRLKLYDLNPENWLFGESFG